MLCVCVNQRANADNSPSCLGHTTMCQWFGIKQYASTRVGCFRSASARMRSKAVVAHLQKQRELGHGTIQRMVHQAARSIAGSSRHLQSLNGTIAWINSIQGADAFRSKGQTSRLNIMAVILVVVSATGIAHIP